MSGPRPEADDGWVATERSRRQARWTAFGRYPHAVIRSRLRRRRGLSERYATPVGANEVLEKLSELPVSVWTYGFDHPSVRHMGPMSQDFARAFGLGDDELTIDMLDANGVVMAACQALHRRVVELEQRVADLEAALPQAGSAEPQ